MRAADVEVHIGRIALVETVAVDAPLELGVLNERTFVERREVTFVDAHLAPYLVAWRNQAVAEAVVDAVSVDIDGERTVGMPAVVVLS